MFYIDVDLCCIIWIYVKVIDRPLDLICSSKCVIELNKKYLNKLIKPIKIGQKWTCMA